jgi:hypothetical protein
MFGRVQCLLRHIAKSKPAYPALVRHHVQWCMLRSLSTASSAGSLNLREPRNVSIGDVSLSSVPGDPVLTPRGKLPAGSGDGGGLAAPSLTQDTLGHLRWLLQKDGLSQDVFLVGPPGPRRRQLALQYCELVGREYEYVCITRDTTESDLKQRRDILNGSGVFSDGAPVRAAIEGRILILEVCVCLCVCVCVCCEWVTLYRCRAWSVQKETCYLH